MKIFRTKPDMCKTNYDEPPTFQNDVTHWWDGSQLYGSDQKTHERVRAFADGKLNVDDDGLLPVDPKTNIDITGNAVKLICYVDNVFFNKTLRTRMFRLGIFFIFIFTQDSPKTGGLD